MKRFSLRHVNVTLQEAKLKEQLEYFLKTSHSKHFHSLLLKVSRSCDVHYFVPLFTHQPHKNPVNKQLILLNPDRKCPRQ